MLKSLIGPPLTAWLLWSALAVAEPPRATDVAKPAPGGARKDPRGVKGISPFWEAVKSGDSAFVARDVAGAIAAYEDAISKEPNHALGHYRLGEAQLAKGDLQEAEQAFLNGLRVVGATEPALKGKLLFALADLRERQKAWDDASAKWAVYETSSTQQKTGSPASGTERERAVSVWKQLSVDSAEVKARIQKGIAAADEAVRKSSK